MGVLYVYCMNTVCTLCVQYVCCVYSVRIMCVYPTFSVSIIHVPRVLCVYNTCVPHVLCVFPIQIQEGSDDISIQSCDVSSKLTISSGQQEHCGCYTIELRNSFGLRQAALNLTIVGR